MSSRACIKFLNPVIDAYLKAVRVQRKTEGFWPLLKLDAVLQLDPITKAMCIIRNGSGSTCGIGMFCTLEIGMQSVLITAVDYFDERNKTGCKFQLCKDPSRTPWTFEDICVDEHAQVWSNQLLGASACLISEEFVNDNSIKPLDLGACKTGTYVATLFMNKECTPVKYQGGLITSKNTNDTQLMHTISPPATEMQAVNGWPLLDSELALVGIHRGKEGNKQYAINMQHVATWIRHSAEIKAQTSPPQETDNFLIQKGFIKNARKNRPPVYCKSSGNISFAWKAPFWYWTNLPIAPNTNFDEILKRSNDWHIIANSSSGQGEGVDGWDKDADWCRTITEFTSKITNTFQVLNLPIRGEQVNFV